LMSLRLVQRASKAWDHAGLRRITLHECRHTYASLLMAAGYTLKELMEFIGHADLQMVNRYVNCSRSRARTTRRHASMTISAERNAARPKHGMASSASGPRPPVVGAYAATNTN
jgi:integrase